METKTISRLVIGVVLVTWLTVTARAQTAPNSSGSPVAGNKPILRAVDPRAMEMQQAVLQKQDLKEMKRILGAGFKIDDPIGCGTFNSVDGAVSVGNVKMLKFLLANGAQPKESALFQAVWQKKPEVSLELVETLMKAGADGHYQERYPSTYVAGDTHLPDTNRFSSPLHVACYKGNYEVAKLLLTHPGEELNALDIDGRTPLMWAAANGDDRMVKLLLGKGANSKVQNGRGETAMSLAAARRDGDKSRILQLIASSSRAQ